MCIVIVFYCVFYSIVFSILFYCVLYSVSLFDFSFLVLIISGVDTTQTSYVFTHFRCKSYKIADASGIRESFLDSHRSLLLSHYFMCEPNRFHWVELTLNLSTDSGLTLWIESFESKSWYCAILWGIVIYRNGLDGCSLFIITLNYDCVDYICVL